MIVRSILLTAAPLLLLSACEPETPRPPPAGEVCWNVVPSEASSRCTDQRLCLKKDDGITVDDPSSAGFICDPYQPACRVPDDEHIERTYGLFDYDDPGKALSVSLAFKGPIMRGYSLANFGEYFDSAKISWIAERGASAGSGPLSSGQFGWMEDSQPKVEFLAYDPPLLHVRVTASGVRVNTSNTTDPYLCFPSNGPVPIPGDPQLCTEVHCHYDADAADKVRFVAELNIPIQQPQN